MSRNAIVVTRWEAATPQGAGTPDGPLSAGRPRRGTAGRDARRHALGRTERLAVVVGTGIGGVTTPLGQDALIEQQGPRRISPLEGAHPDTPVGLGGLLAAPASSSTCCRSSACRRRWRSWASGSAAGSGAALIVASIFVFPDGEPEG